MTQYKYTVNGSSVIGNLTWNANGSLAKLVITDPFNSSNAQTCNYAYDDLARIASANCGAIWNETFGYSGGGQTTGAFGNLTKSAVSGAYDFNPNYSQTSNRMTALGSQTPTYDTNGTGSNTFTYDAEGRPLSAQPGWSHAITYDALGRWLEINWGGGFEQMAYAPTGAKMGVMTTSGSTLGQGWIPLSAGAQAQYCCGTTGVNAYWHPDWLGGARLQSSASRTVTGDGAYGPFGEVYAQSPNLYQDFTGANTDLSSSLLLAWVVVLLVVTLHEFAHGLTCKHFGGHVNEIGFLLIYFQPAFYCNVSDAWLFPERSKRLWVTFAGAYFEMFLWAVATFVWKLAEPGSTIQYLALVVVATSAVKSLFNLNPLIKLDGYYLLSDYLEIPNLRQRASRYLRSVFLPSWASSAPSGEISARDRRIFLIYGGLSAVYSTWLLYIVATWAARYLVAQYRGLGFLAFCALLGMVFWNSIKKVVSGLTTKLPQLWQNSGIRSQPKRAALAAGATLITLFLPWADLDQAGQFTVLPERNADVHAEVSGFIDQVLVQEGQTVRPGDELATMSDRDLKAQREEVGAQVQAQQAKLLLLVNGPRPQEITMAQGAVATATTRTRFTRKSFKVEEQLRAQRLASAAARAELAPLQAERDFLDHQIGLTKVVSPVAGVVATHRTRELIGKFVQKGDLILKVDELKTVTGRDVGSRAGSRDCPGRPARDAKNRGVPWTCLQRQGHFDCPASLRAGCAAARTAFPR